MSSTATDTQNDASFTLYDLYVEITCPPGARILCGAKAGDYFTVQGEMIHLPPGQGISFYTLCKPEILVPFRVLIKRGQVDMRKYS